MDQFLEEIIAKDKFLSHGEGTESYMVEGVGWECCNGKVGE